MLKLALFVCLVAFTAAEDEEENRVKYGGEIEPWVPFPHFEDLALYKMGDATYLPGTAFVAVAEDGTCKKVELTDEMGGFCPLNQTICDQIVANVCTAEQANVTCFDSPELGATPPPGQPTDVPDGEFGNDYPYGGPLCHVEINGQKYQPSSYTAIFTLSPKVATCVFQVAPPPTVYPPPTEEPEEIEDPYCPYVDH